MELFDGILSVKGVTFLIFSVMIIAATGYLLGRITIKGVSLGTAGVFLMALFYGGACDGVFYARLSDQMNASFVKNSLSIIDTLGLVLFVSAVGFIAGPNFFSNFKKNFKSFVALAIIVILAADLPVQAVSSSAGTSQTSAMMNSQRLWQAFSQVLSQVRPDSQQPRKLPVTSLRTQ